MSLISGTKQPLKSNKYKHVKHDSVFRFKQVQPQDRRVLELMAAVNGLACNDRPETLPRAYRLLVLSQDCSEVTA